MECCPFPSCNTTFGSEETDNIRIVRQPRGLNNLIKCATERGDQKLLDIFKDIKLPFKVHVDCAKNYTRAKSVKAAQKRKLEHHDDDCSSGAERSLRSKREFFDPKQQCLFCAADVLDEIKKPKERRQPVSVFEKLCEGNLKASFEKFDTITAKVVKERYDQIMCVCSDLVSAKGRYHRCCQKSFLACGELPKMQNNETHTSRGRPVNKNLDYAFKMVIKYLDENDDCQYLMSDLKEIMEANLDESSMSYGDKYLTKKLKEFYGENMIETTNIGKHTIITFKERAHGILRENWKKGNLGETEEKHLIIRAAASYIRDSIRSKPYHLSSYPNMSNMNQQTVADEVPEEVRLFLDEVIKSKTENDLTARKKSAIAHAIISACRPRSFVSVLLMSISTYIHRKHGSRELIDLLSSLGFAESYQEVQLFINNILCTKSASENIPQLDAFVQYIFDNADFNPRNESGNNSWHVMGGIAAITPESAVPPPLIIERRKDPVLHHESKFIPLVEVPPPEIKDAFTAIKIKPLPASAMSSSVHTIDIINKAWAALHLIDNKGSGWGGFTKSIYSNHRQEAKSRIVILPFALDSPSKLSTIYSCLKFARQNTCMNALIVTFDQPLYAKAFEICAHHPSLLKNSLMRLGEFHLIMSYMGCCGFIMSGSGIEDLWETVYAKGSIPNMITGHSYSRALKAHLLTNASLMTLLMEFDPDMISILHKVKRLFQSDIPLSSKIDSIPTQKLLTAINAIEAMLKSCSNTAKLWLTYMEMVEDLKMFIACIRLSNIEGYYYILCKMIPIFHSAGHLAYAKYARLYVQQLSESRNWMSPDEQAQFFEEGRAMIRRFDVEWSGNEPDKVIEQDLMRLLKVKGGLTRGRGMTENTLAKFSNAFQEIVPIIEALEGYCKVNTSTSEQHKDLRDSSIKTHNDNAKKFIEWLKQHPPFKGNNGQLKNLATGRVPDENVNCQHAIEIGRKLASTLDDKSFDKCNLKTKDKVVNMSSNLHTFKIRGEEKCINPDILFHRICCTINNNSEMREYLEYELTQAPPALFKKDGSMRTNNKSELGKLLKERVKNETFKGNTCVVDGGHLLHTIGKWEIGMTYKNICEEYLKYVRELGDKVLIRFDGYSNHNLSTKSALREVRSKNKASKTFQFDLSMTLQTDKEAFLANYSNKARLISFLSDLLRENGLNTEQSIGDADYDVAQATLRESLTAPTLCLAKDTDILIMLVNSVDDHAKGLFFGPMPYNTVNILQIKESLIPTVVKLLPALHGLSDNDTTSGIFSKGKKTIYALVTKNPSCFEYLEKLYESDLSHEEVSQIVERFLLSLYKGRLKSKSNVLNELRYELYIKTIGKAKLTVDFELKKLPPTSEAAQQHAYRAYHTIQQWREMY